MLCLSIGKMFVWSENGANKIKAFVKDIIGARMMIMWEEKFVDPPPVACITSLNLM